MWISEKWKQFKQAFHDWNHGKSQSSLRQQFPDIFLLDPKAFVKRDRQKDCVTTVSCHFSNINLYELALQTALDTIGTETRFLLPFQSTLTTITVDKLFMNGANKYLDAPQALEDIKKLSIRLVQKIEQEHEDIGTRGYNKRTSYKLVLSVNALAEQLHKYSS